MQTDGTVTVYLSPEEVTELVRKAGLPVDGEWRVGDPRFNEEGELEFTFAWGVDGIRPDQWAKPPAFVGRRSRIMALVDSIVTGNDVSAERLQDLKRELQEAL